MIWKVQLMWIAKKYLVITVCQELFLLFLLNLYNKYRKLMSLLTHFTDEIAEVQRIK